MERLEEEIAQLLRKYQAQTGKLLTIGSIESATGGRIGDKLTNVPGSSDYYKGSVIAYSNEIKATVVGVKEKTLKTHGAVSSETAIEMAKGGRKLLKVDICISDTGIAGPAGATSEKPVGLFYLGLSTKYNTFSRKHSFKGNREQNKQNATEAALNMLKKYLQKLLSKVDDKPIEEKHVVTCFLEYGNKILILKRSLKVGSYQGKWAGVSGYVETSDVEQAVTEIKEETGLSQNEVKLLAKGKPLRIVDSNLRRRWVIHPFLFHAKSPGKIKIDWEHDEVTWIKPEELINYDTVPGLNDALDRVIYQIGKPMTTLRRS
jgi:PncC family amidohydrolase